MTNHTCQWHLSQCSTATFTPSSIHRQIHRKQTQTCCVPQKLFANLDELAMMETIGLWCCEESWRKSTKKRNTHPDTSNINCDLWDMYVRTYLWGGGWLSSISIYFFGRGVPTIPYLSEKQTSYHEEMIPTTLKPSIWSDESSYPTPPSKAQYQLDG